MRVLLEGFRLARGGRLGGIDSYWEQLVTRLLADRDEDEEYALLSAFLHPRHVRNMARWRRRGAEVHHWWASPDWLVGARKFGVSAESLAGRHDVFHVPEPNWSVSTRGRLVVSCHDLMYLHYPQFLRPEWTARLMRDTAALARRATYWVCNSAHTRDDLVRHFGVPRGRTCVTLLGVDPSFRAAGQDPEAVVQVRSRLGRAGRPYFLFVGSMEPKKNLAVLLEAFGVALATGEVGADLVVAGRTGWGDSGLDEILRRRPALRERVQFTGFVDQPDLPPLVAGACALVLPSRYEGFGMPVVEAMAAGTPVLCSDRGALPEVAGGAAEHFDPDDVEGLAALLERVDADEAFCENLRARGRDHSAAFTWERCAEQTVAAYRAAVRLPR